MALFTKVSMASAQVKLNGIGAISSFTDGEKYNIGVGRKFSDKLSGTSLLSPTNGTDTYSIGVNYVTESVDVAFGYAMSSFGDKAVTTAYGTGNFTNNDATTTGLRIKFKLP